MSVEAHKCNVPGCKGFIVFENAEFKLDKPPLVEGMYQFASPTCTECGKQYKVVPHYVVISVDDHGDVEGVNSASIEDWEKRERQRKFEMETDPLIRIELFIAERRYTYSPSDIIAEYLKYQDSKCYLSHSMKDCITNLENELKELVKGSR